MEHLGTIYGLAFIMLLVVIIIWRGIVKKKKVTAHYQESRKYDKPVQELIELVGKALEDINAKKIAYNSSTSVFSAKLEGSIWSWSEILEINLESSEHETTVAFSSQCSLPSQILDWGKNRRNSKRFFNKLEIRTYANMRG